MPTNMPTDNYFNQFEENIIAAQSLFWGRSYQWQFADFRHLNSNQMENNQQLINAINQEQEVTDNTILECLQKYYNFMNPQVGVKACACCGRIDIPVTIEENILSSNILTFTTINVNDENLNV